ncbi:hypothetical protein, partial [Marichromatium sp. AB31]|uniref:hypothetical protein n=1 Tax=Marichromatium sp. AB31 TaxID=2483362 RepID=UPI001680465C
SKYSFFDIYNEERRASVDKNIDGLLREFGPAGDLGYQGFCLLFVCRDYVYTHLEPHRSTTVPHDPRGAVFRISEIKDYMVVRSRLQLLSEAINAINAEKPGKAKLFEGAEGVINKALSLDGSRDAPWLSAVRELCQHGYRSFVCFLSSLRIDLKRYDVFERLFFHQTAPLLVLYISNCLKRYTQDQKHFPNIFLVDATVLRDKSKGREEAHKPHLHTYWLKYLVLKFLAQCERDDDAAADLQEVIDVFCGEDGYEEHLVRLVVGSLCSEDEYRCAEVNYEGFSHGNLMHLPIRLTPRGKYMTSFDDVLYKDRSFFVDFCFSFSYLGTIMDDYLMAVPDYLLDELLIDENYSYLYLPDAQYGKEVVKVLRGRIKGVEVFLGMILGELRAEMSFHKSVFENLSFFGVIPDEGQVINGMLEEVGHIFSQSKKEECCFSVSRLQKRIKDSESFFLDYFDKKDLVSP